MGPLDRFYWIVAGGGIRTAWLRGRKIKERVGVEEDNRLGTYFGRASRAVHLRRRYDPMGHNAYMYAARGYVVGTYTYLYCFKGSHKSSRRARQDINRKSP